MERKKSANNLNIFYSTKLSGLGQDNRKVFSDAEDFRKQASPRDFLDDDIPQAATEHVKMKMDKISVERR